MKYKCNEKFLIRMPTLPLNICKKMLHVNSLTYLNFNDFSKEEMEFIMKIIQVSSVDLYKQILKRGNLERLNNEERKSLYKYIIRSSSRSTPFGLSAGVQIGSFNRISKQIFCEGIKPYFSPDMEWIFGVARLIEKNEIDKMCIKVIWNNNCLRLNNRIANFCVSNRGFGGTTKVRSSIRYTNLIKIIEQESKEYIKIKELIKIIQLEYEGVPIEKIFKVIKMLIEEEYLLTCIRLTSNYDDYLSSIILQTENKDLEENSLKLIDIKNDIDFFNRDFSNVTREKLNFIISKMKSINESKDYLQVISVMKLRDPYLNIEIKKRLEKFVNTISLISLESMEAASIKNLTEKFQEVFGENIEVPLSIVLDPNGFNALEEYECNLIEETNQRNKDLVDYLKLRIQEASLKKERILNISINDFNENLLTNKLIDRGNKSFDLICSVIVDKGDAHISIGAGIGSNIAGGTVQRFAKCIKESEINEYDKMYEVFGKDKCEYVEIRELPTQARLLNVMNDEVKLNKNLSFNMNANAQSIFLKDIIMGYQRDLGLYLKDKVSNNIIKFEKTNMLNRALNSKLYNFLIDITNQYSKLSILETIMMFREIGFFYTPEIRIEGVTISPEKWIIDDRSIKLNTLDTFKKDFQNIQRDFNIPKYLYLCNADHRLLINSKKEIGIELLFEEIKKKRVLNLQSVEEKFFDNETILNKEKENYAMECTFSFFTEECLFETEINNPKLDVTDAIFPPFSDGWLYIKIKMDPEVEDEFISEISNYLQIQNICLYFFIRYHDEFGSHIRLRIKYLSPKEALSGYEKLSIVLGEYREYGICSEWNISEYIREKNRYGGENFIDEIERFFYYDSLYVMKDIKGTQLKVRDRMIVSILAIILMLTRDKIEALNILDSITLKEKYRDVYSKERRKYLQLSNKVENEIIQDIRFKQAKVLKNLMIKEKESMLNSKEDIILSLLHMTCNRISRNRKVESEAHHIVRHIIYENIQKEKYGF